MKLDFDIVSQGGVLDFEIKNTKTINASGGIGEDVVRDIVAKATADLQPKRDETLKTQSKEIVGAINELHEREDKQGLTEEQVKEVVRETAVTQEADPTVPAWAKQSTKPTYSYNEIKDKPENLATKEYADNASKQAVSQGVTAHNVSQDTHKDIRNLISELSNRLNAIADSDDNTLDQLSEIVAYIKANKALIESVTTSKVNVSDIINDLETNVANKPLSASQGVALKTLINALEQSVNTLTEKANEFEENAVSDIGSQVVEETNELAIELKDKNGKVIATTKVTLPTQETPEIDLSGYVKNTDRNQFVKDGVVENDIPLTDDEKASACEWLGAVKRRPNENNGWNRVYGMSSTGEECVFRVANGTDGGTIPIRGANGRLIVGNPVEGREATPKSYVDNLVGDIESVLNSILGV